MVSFCPSPLCWPLPLRRLSLPLPRWFSSPSLTDTVLALTVTLLFLLCSSYYPPLPSSPPRPPVAVVLHRGQLLGVRGKWERFPPSYCCDFTSHSHEAASSSFVEWMEADRDFLLNRFDLQYLAPSSKVFCDFIFQIQVSSALFFFNPRLLCMLLIVRICSMMWFGCVRHCMKVVCSLSQMYGGKKGLVLSWHVETFGFYRRGLGPQEKKIIPKEFFLKFPFRESSWNFVNKIGNFKNKVEILRSKWKFWEQSGYFVSKVEISRIKSKFLE